MQRSLQQTIAVEALLERSVMCAKKKKKGIKGVFFSRVLTQKKTCYGGRGKTICKNTDRRIAQVQRDIDQD